MKKILTAGIILALLTACNMSKNPLLVESHNPFGAPQFDIIEVEHYEPAFKEAIAEAKREIEAIAGNKSDPTFENTILALEYAGRELGNVSSIFFNLYQCLSSEAMQQIAQTVSPAMTEYSLSIILNEDLFKRVKAVYDNRDNLDLGTEERRLLEKTFTSFSRNGANLSPEQKQEYSKIAEELSLLALRFNNNLLAATNGYYLHITDKKDLEGLPEFVVEMGESEAKQKGVEGWVYTLHQPSYSPFMQYSNNRELREKLWREYNNKCIGGEYDNSEIIRKTIDLRIRQANLLGYKTFSEYAVAENMAKTPENINKFLNNLLEKSLPFAKNDVLLVSDFAKKHGLKGKLMPWDWSYYAEKLKNEKYSLNDELLKPYFSLENVEKAAFDLASKLYGLKFDKREDIPVYHPDVKVYEVSDQDGRHMSLLYMDYFPRESKSNGAWMTSFREQGFYKGVEERPFVSIVCNFTKPTTTAPSLLTFYEVTTLFHEFGHALHGILAEGKFSSLTGTNVARDFVELPSQIMENWAHQPEFLVTFAKNYSTGERIPDDYIVKIELSKNYLAGYLSIRQLNFGLTDMAWHDLTEAPQTDIIAFEQDAIKKSSILPVIDGIAFSPSFSHIFSGGYSAGYYSYKWAEVLEADAFSLFLEKGIFNKDVAESFRDNILSKGNIEDADVLFRNFRGREPDADALLRKSGMIK